MQIQKFKMSAAAILDFENMLSFLNHLTNLHQTWQDCYDIDVEHIPNIEKYANTKIQNGGCRHLEFRKTAAISLLFDRF
jgi:hypothetical protein